MDPTSPSSAPLPRVGILGAGQLGRMLQEAAHRLSVPVVCLDTPADAPAKQLSLASANVASGSFRSADDIRKFVTSQNVDVLTVEIEHVDTHILDALLKERPNLCVYPAPSTIRTIQDKHAQKAHLRAHNVPVADFVSVASPADLLRAANDGGFGFPLMLKAKREAYDGRGNYVVKSAADVEAAFTALNPKRDPEALYVERWVPFVRELATMVVRDAQGHVVAYPVVETVHTRNICHVVVAPAQIDGLLAKKVQKVAEQCIASFDGAGIFGVEMFQLENGDIYINEIAPRPHNSGHYTIEACHTSQFENHLRVLAGLPIGSTDLKVPFACMLNVLGAPSSDLVDSLAACRTSLTVPGATVHLYGKAGCRADRKLGHITVVANTFPELQAKMGTLLAVDPTAEKAVQAALATAGGSAAALAAAVSPALRIAAPKVGIIMGSDSDLPVMRAAADMLDQFEVPYEVTIVSAHRTPLRMVQYAQDAHHRGIQVIIAGAGGAAHLPGMVAAITPLPVIGVPVALKVLDGQDSLLSIVQMPRGVPVATVAINNATNAGLLAVRIVGSAAPHFREKMAAYMKRMEQEVMGKVDRLAKVGHKDY
ncbi:phosphoribosylaminoimidazole carboxylase, ATPase subunit [Allomyces macrogynus ATCC 38327]|uniref:Phosphoribosylaminoimidazole carboxylase n=1 Tax=Allomyces macrogynus (strain ATCC 38327) TaxID=578462 RepID=A0A0L0S1E0_ALLM3|nr:phosphoribosylaminoimidazole carboxylase, ATPase subunit [Allomyces macrogynus ATCC 38327]|eukprot:KNE56397.1 phosphoribosylaminoimidazole carboxylase, ATPase subunit [Allomyces macrogynus ATCC 38327]